jgi:hypothetical protein
MTLKEKVEQVCPKDTGKAFVLGVRGCPSDYDFLHQKATCSRNCEACWNREYKEPAEE